MLLSIDKKKIEDQLAKHPPIYVVTSQNLETEEIHPAIPTSDVYSMNVAMEETPTHKEAKISLGDFFGSNISEAVSRIKKK